MASTPGSPYEEIFLRDKITQTCTLHLSANMNLDVLLDVQAPVLLCRLNWIKFYSNGTRVIDCDCLFGLAQCSKSGDMSAAFAAGQVLWMVLVMTNIQDGN